MNDSFETPTHAPVSAGSKCPWTYRVSYKSGKIQEGFSEIATPEMAKVGFSYFDKGAAETVILEDFTAYIVAVLSGVSGVVKDGDRYHNYWSSLVFDTRTQPLSVFLQGIDRPQFTGLYQKIKPELPNGVGFGLVFICYIPEKDALVAVNLTVGLQNAIQNAIGTACNTPANKISLFGLCEMKNQFWGIRFAGGFEKKTKEGQPHAGKGEMFFMPKMRAGVITQEKQPTLWEKLDGYAQDVRAYVDGYAEKINTGPAVTPTGPTTPPAATGRTPANTSNAHEVPFPTDDVTSHPEDDLPF